MTRHSSIGVDPALDDGGPVRPAGPHRRHAASAANGSLLGWRPGALDEARIDALCAEVDDHRFDALSRLVHAALREPRRG